jgi:hypothetical protein
MYCYARRSPTNVEGSRTVTQSGVWIVFSRWFHSGSIVQVDTILNGPVRRGVVRSKVTDLVGWNILAFEASYSIR